MVDLVVVLTMHQYGIFSDFKPNDNGMLDGFVFGEFKGVFNEREENHGYDFLVADFSFDFEIHVGSIGRPDFLQFDVVSDLFDFTGQGCFVFVGFVKYVAENVGQFFQIIGSDLGRFLDEDVDVVEGVEQEVGVELRFQQKKGIFAFQLPFLECSFLRNIQQPLDDAFDDCCKNAGS